MVELAWQEEITAPVRQMFFAEQGDVLEFDRRFRRHGRGRQTNMHLEQETGRP